MTIGVVVGTYSSIYVAANMLLALGVTKEDLMLPEKGAQQRTARDVGTTTEEGETGWTGRN